MCVLFMSALISKGSRADMEGHLYCSSKVYEQHFHSQVLVELEFVYGRISKGNRLRSDTYFIIFCNLFYMVTLVDLQGRVVLSLISKGSRLGTIPPAKIYSSEVALSLTSRGNKFGALQGGTSIYPVL